MKVIGLIPVKYSDDVYICQVTREEIKKYFNMYYGKEELGSIAVGSEIDLGKGYDFYVDTNNALKKTQEFIESNKKTLDAIINGIQVMGKNGEVNE